MDEKNTFHMLNLRMKQLRTMTWLMELHGEIFREYCHGKVFPASIMMIWTLVPRLIATHIIQAARGWSADANSILGTNKAELSSTDRKLKLSPLLQSFLASDTASQGHLCVLEFSM